MLSRLDLVSNLLIIVRLTFELVTTVAIHGVEVSTPSSIHTYSKTYKSLRNVSALLLRHHLFTCDTSTEFKPPSARLHLSS